jgi:hypothetical protein
MPYQVQFPYLGNQGILISDRVHLHARQDSVLILGKKAVGISSTGPIGIESSENVTLDAVKIELGLNAQQKIILGDRFFEELTKFLEIVINAGSNLQQVSKTDVAGSMMAITVVGGQLQNAATSLKNSLASSLSQKSYVK